VRAAAYQALGRLLVRDPARLAPHIRRGIADANPHVRRRAVLAAAGARGLALRPLLEPLTDDPDPQVRRIVRRILPQRTEADIVQRAS
jgi:HEAT repeat protein